MPINDLTYQYEDAHDKQLMESVSVCEMVRVVAYRGSTVDVQPLCHKLIDGK